MRRWGQPSGKLPAHVQLCALRIVLSTNHSRAREDIPTEANSIPFLHLAPLLLQSIHVHCVCPLLISLRFTFGMIWFGCKLVQ